jgi:hypothetical protein
MVQHRVAHYEVWRKAYDGFSDAQKTAGVTRQSVYRADDDPNNLLVIHGFATTAEAEKFLTGAELRDAMRQAVSRASHESRSTRTCSRPGKPGSPGHRYGCRAGPAARSGISCSTAPRTGAAKPQQKS